MGTFPHSSIENAPSHAARWLQGDDAAPLIILPGGAVVSRGAFRAQVTALARRLPQARHVINLCERRDHFLVGLCAAASRGQITLLPPSRAEDVVGDVRRRYPDTITVGDAGAALAVDVRVEDSAAHASEDAISHAEMDADAGFIVGFTSGSTGVPQPYPKTLGSFLHTTAANERGLASLRADDTPFGIVATVPPQHMYGMELSVMLPLLGPAAVHAGRPFFPQDIATALADVPAPRLLVTTPLHLRALVESKVSLPPLAAIVTATAPLPVELAQATEDAFGCEVREMFGATETCVIAMRRTAIEAHWQLLPDVMLEPLADGTRVQRPSLPEPVTLADSLQCTDDGRGFVLIGRQADMLEIAGKRASLGDLTRRLQSVAGVRDGVIAQQPDVDASGVRRLVAVVCADAAVQDRDIIDALRTSTDPVFLPRRVIRVDALPRNETGKLPRAALDVILARNPRDLHHAE